MGQKYQSTALYHGQPIDCTALRLSYEFYELSDEQCHALFADELSFVRNITETSFVAKWEINEKIRWKFNRTNVDTLCKGTKYNFSCEAFAESELVFDRMSFQKFNSFIQRDFLAIRHFFPGLSADYRNEWNSLFPEGRPTNEIIEANIQKLFSFENKKLISTYCIPDLCARFTSAEYLHQTGLYYGTFSICISAFCIGEMLNDFADLFYTHLLGIATTHCNLNARIMLEPIYGHAPDKSPYMRYFGINKDFDDSHLEVNRLPVEWYPTYYVCGIEWANIISPLSQMHLNMPSIFEAGETDDIGIEIQRLAGGALLVKAKPNIEKYSISDARIIKKLIYPALHSGYSCISLRRLFEENVPNAFMSTFPRSDWAIVPILDGEIEVIGTDLIISHNAKL